MSAWADLDRDLLRRALATPAPAQALESARSAAVSVLLVPRSGGVELLLIRRPERASDPWSGHVALPGGHRDAGDSSLLFTAIRETREEVGVELREEDLVGTLDDVSPVLPRPLLVRPFVFVLPARPTLSPSDEVDTTFWTDVGDLASGRHSAEHQLLYAGQQHRYPAFRVGAHVIWGLTYRVVGSLITRVATELERQAMARAVHEPRA